MTYFSVQRNPTPIHSLSGVTDIVRQALELIASVFRIPAVKFLGISPSGFNATGESDLRNFYDMIATLQEEQLGQNMQKVLQILQLNRYGSIDGDVCAEWIELGKKETKEKAETQKIKADTIAVLYDRQIVTQEESRRVLASDKEGYFSFLDIDSEEDFETDEAMAMLDDADGADVDIDDVDKAGAEY